MEKYQNKKPRKKLYPIYLDPFNLAKISSYLQKQNRKSNEVVNILIKSLSISISIQIQNNNPNSLEDRLQEEKKQEEVTLEENVKENIIEFPYQPEDSYIKNKYQRTEIYQFGNNTTDNSSGAAVRYVSPSQLPSGPGWKALGMYDPSTHTIYIANNLSPEIERFVYHHEVAHAKGIRNEQQADSYASSIVGYNIRNAA